MVYTSGGTELHGYLAWDESREGPRPGVLVVHEWWGHNEYARSRAKQLAEMGYTALALDMYGNGDSADHPEGAGKLMQAAMADLDVAIARFEAARDLLEAHPTTDPEKTVAIGYCFGGGVVLHMARIGMDLDAVASFHGMLAPIEPAAPGAVKARVMVFHGEADPWLPPAVVDAFKQEMADAGADLRFFSYPGAKHAFTNPAATENGRKFGLPLEYDRAADLASWEAFSQGLAELYPED